MRAATSFRGVTTVWTPPHNSRPGGGGSLLAGQETGLFPPNLPTVSINAGTRNGPVNYGFPAIKLTANNVQPFQTSRGAAARAIGEHAPAFFGAAQPRGHVELLRQQVVHGRARAGGGCGPDRVPQEIRLHTQSAEVRAPPAAVPAGFDPRAAAALDAMAAQAGWGNSPRATNQGRRAGKGVAFARYETVETYVAVYAEVEVTTATGEVWVRRVVVAHDCGLIINPDGLKNQIEGNVIQGISRTLIEEVGFNTSGVTSLLWSSTNPTPPPGTTYPVIHFNQVPASIEIVLLDHPEQLTQAAGHACMGCRRTDDRPGRARHRQRDLQRHRQAADGVADHAGSVSCTL